MIRFLLRILWRVLIFTLGAILLSFLLFEALPYADAHMPLYVALLFLYCLVAYIAIPALIRLFRLVIKPDHIPLYATTRDGWPSDPVNIAVIARHKKHFIRQMKHAGWHTEDPHALKNLLREGYAIVFNKKYNNAPLSYLYLFNRHHDLSFQMPNNRSGSPRSRHHVRFWQLTDPGTTKDHGHYTFWKQKFQALFHANHSVWVGAATEDIYPIGIRWRTGQITHYVSGDSNRERDFIIETLAAHTLIRATDQTEPGETVRFRSQQLHTHFVADGALKVITLR